MTILSVPVLPRARFIQNFLVTSVRGLPTSARGVFLLTRGITPASGLFGSFHIAFRHVVCNKGSRNYNPHPKGLDCERTSTWGAREPVQRGSKYKYGVLVLL